MAETALHPSGAQYQIRCGAHVATVVQVGGGLRSYRVGDREILDGYGVDERCSGARGQTLAPWPNRLRDGSYEFAGEQHQTPLSEPAQHNAIHGFVRWRPWDLVEQADDAVTVETVLFPLAGYPFTLRLRNGYRLDGTGLSVTTEASNAGATALPYALGFHPYLAPSGDAVDGDVLTVPGATYLPTDDRGLPTGSRSVEGTDFDFREPRPIGRTEIDLTFTDLARDGAGEAVVTLAAADGSRSTSLWLDASFPYVELFTGDTLPAERRRRRGLGVEPMTGPPNTLQSGTDLVVLQPGETTRHRWGIRPSGR